MRTGILASRGLLLLVVLAGGTTARAADAPAKPPPPIVVDAHGKGDVTTVAEALSRVEGGSRILLRAGVYAETILVTKPVEILGDGKPGSARVETDGASAVQCAADGVRLTGIAFVTRATEGITPAPAVEIVSGDAVLTDCSIASPGPAGLLVLGKDARAELSRCAIAGCGTDGIVAEDGATLACTGCDVDGSNGAGVRAARGASVTLKGGRVRGCAGGGLLAHDGGTARAESCTFTANGIGQLRCTEGGSRLTAVKCEVREGLKYGLIVEAGGKFVVEGGE
ncbi:MAG TPA: right-handed parallel beta-helix repeat-containing protein, partial [Planctomycetota bacterium]|nr:right-handed parallel beta-helix repeat-containing protein [Planctomycetota bacterium]